MKYQIVTEQDTIYRAFEKAFSLAPNFRVNFFHDLRRAFKEEIEDLLTKQGIQVNEEPILRCVNLPGKVIEVYPLKTKYDEELSIKFCSSYGYSDFSLQAVNYTERSYCELPSLLPFVKVREFSIGNIAVLVNDSCDIEVKIDDSIRIVGYSYHISSKRRESYLCLSGIRFKYESLQPIFEKYLDNCDCKGSDLDEILIGNIHFPIIFICRKCGQLFTCKCFENYFDIKDDIIRFLPYGGYNADNELRAHVKRIKIRNNICHLCTNNVPKLKYGHEMYFSKFLQKYLPYYHLFLRRRDDSQPLTEDRAKEIENELRGRFGYPKVGEKWLSETILFKTVQTLFSDKNVIHHYRGKELDGLEIDIWIPDLKLGIEYQGEQHFEMIGHWGREEGLNKRIESDRKKKMLCKKLGYSLIEFQYDEALAIENVESKLRKYLKEE